MLKREIEIERGHAAEWVQGFRRLRIKESGDGIGCAGEYVANDGTLRWMWISDVDDEYSWTEDDE